MGKPGVLQSAGSQSQTRLSNWTTMFSLNFQQDTYYLKLLMRSRWHQCLDGHEFEWTPGIGDGQGGLACCDSWGCKGSDTTEQLNWTELNWMRSRRVLELCVKYLLLAYGLRVFLMKNSLQRLLSWTLSKAINSSQSLVCSWVMVPSPAQIIHQGNRGFNVKFQKNQFSWLPELIGCIFFNSKDKSSSILLQYF